MFINNTQLFDCIFKTQQTKHILVMGDTINHEKFAAKIFNLLNDKQYHVYGVDKQYQTINEIGISFDAVILCMHPAKCINLLKPCLSQLKNVIIQPGAESDDIINLLEQANIAYTHGCVLKYFKVNEI